jgi:hypothetical protein
MRAEVSLHCEPFRDRLRDASPVVAIYLKRRGKQRAPLDKAAVRTSGSPPNNSEQAGVLTLPTVDSVVSVVCPPRGSLR